MKKYLIAAYTISVNYDNVFLIEGDNDSKKTYFEAMRIAELEYYNGTTAPSKRYEVFKRALKDCNIGLRKAEWIFVNGGKTFLTESVKSGDKTLLTFSILRRARALLY